MVLIGGKDNEPPVFVRFVESRHSEVVDALIDAGYKIGQCAEWYYNAQLNSKHSEKIPNARLFDLDQEDEFDL